MDFLLKHSLSRSNRTIRPAWALLKQERDDIIFPRS